MLVNSAPTTLVRHNGMAPLSCNYDVSGTLTGVTTVHLADVNKYEYRGDSTGDDLRDDWISKMLGPLSDDTRTKNAANRLASSTSSLDLDAVPGTEASQQEEDEIKCIECLEQTPEDHRKRDRDRRRRSRCLGCLSNAPNQVAHMDYGGCLDERREPDDDSDASWNDQSADEDDGADNRAKKQRHEMYDKTSGQSSITADTLYVPETPPSTPLKSSYRCRVICESPLGMLN